MTAKVLCGVAGWSYDDWKGVVYPKACRDTLRFVARHVDFVELNTTFYRTPTRDVVASWVERTADLGTRFTAKLPQEVTHRGVIDAGNVAAFRAALEPLADAGRLDALLAQFSYRLEATDAAFGQLRAIASAFGGMAPLLLEVRHRSWRARDAQARVVESGFRLVHLDYAGMETAFAGPDPELQRDAGIEYLRLHGRNRDAWFDKDAGRDATYDWLYGAGEVDAIEGRIAAIAAAAGTTTAMVAANNHFQGKALVLALELTAWATADRVDVPQSLVDAYPQLARVARRAQRDLF